MSIQRKHPLPFNIKKETPYASLFADNKLKENIEPLKETSILDLTPISYTHQSIKHYGFSVEEIEKKHPCLVANKQVKLNNMIPLLLHEIKLLHQQINQLNKINQDNQDKGDQAKQVNNKILAMEEKRREDEKKIQMLITENKQTRDALSELSDKVKDLINQINRKESDTASLTSVVTFDDSKIIKEMGDAKKEIADYKTMLSKEIKKMKTGLEKINKEIFDLKNAKNE